MVVLHSDSKSFTAEVVATVSEPDGTFSVTRQASFVGIGAVTGLTDADEQKLADCVVRLIQLGGDRRSLPTRCRWAGALSDHVRDQPGSCGEVAGIGEGAQVANTDQQCGAEERPEAGHGLDDRGLRMLG